MNCFTPSAGPRDNGRQQPRRHLYLSATLCSVSGSYPVNVRNISPSGVLIEAANLPAPGSEIVLKRGYLQSAGEIVWVKGRQAGVAFRSPVLVSNWMSRTAHSQQHRIDQIVVAHRANACGELGAGIHDPQRSHTIGQEALKLTSIEAELKALRRDVSDLEASLVADPILAATHPEIQALDIALQRIDRMIASLTSC